MPEGSAGGQCHYGHERTFSNLTDSDVFAYDPDNDPLSNLHATVRTPTRFGSCGGAGIRGSTAEYEFDVLTGMQTNALSASTQLPFRGEPGIWTACSGLRKRTATPHRFSIPGTTVYKPRERLPLVRRGGNPFCQHDGGMSTKAVGDRRYMAGQIEKVVCGI